MADTITWEASSTPHAMSPTELTVIDSHTEGEPTRIVVAGAPDLGGGAVRDQRDRLRAEHDWIRTSLINEPRGSDVMVGGILCPPIAEGCDAGVIFFNNVGYLNMCGHGTMGAVVTLAHLGRVGPGRRRIETPVGVVETELHEDGRVSVENVPSYRFATDVTVITPSFGPVKGDVAWGGNWFFLVKEHELAVEASYIPQLAAFTEEVRWRLVADNITGESGAEIDHIEVFGPSDTADSRSFVMCPGGAYDRSPCGTGTSAKVACLAEEGKLAEDQVWRQESIVGGIFEARYRRSDGAVVPTLTGRAFVNAEVRVLFNPQDPFRYGIASGDVAV